MYRLYYHPITVALAPHIALEEIAAPYELVKVDLYGALPPGYAKLHPLGRVPVLEHDGLAMFESSAIIMHLCDRHPEAGLAPALGDPRRAHFYQWLVFAAAHLHPALKPYNYPQRFSADPADAPAIKAKAAETFADLFRTLERAVDPGPYLLGDRFSACDLPLFAFTNFIEPGMTPLSAFPRLARFAERVRTRPAVGRVLGVHGLA